MCTGKIVDQMFTKWLKMYLNCIFVFNKCLLTLTSIILEILNLYGIIETYVQNKQTK